MKINLTINKRGLEIIINKIGFNEGVKIQVKKEEDNTFSAYCICNHCGQVLGSAANCITREEAYEKAKSGAKNFCYICRNRL